MTTAAPVSRWAEAFEDVRPRLPQTPWLAARREQALSRFRERGFPTTHDEAWRTTSLQPIVRTAFAPAPPPDEAVLERARLLLAAEALPADLPLAVLVNGRFVPALSRLEDLPAGVEVTSLALALGSAEAVGLPRRLAALLPDDGEPFAALNTALWEDGLLVRFRREADLDAPVQVVALSVGGSQPTATHPRFLYVAEAGSRGAVVERWAGHAGGPWLTNAAVETYVETNARFDLLQVQAEADEAWHFRSFAARLERDARAHLASLHLGARLARNEVQVVLAGDGTELALDGLTLARGDQHVDHRTNIDHAARAGISRQLYKGILDDAARAVFAGRILVRPGATQTDAKQANHNLLLSDRARADSVPQLEILTDDVKCAHGATVGQIDEEALFYLRSRALDVRTARALLLRAFAGEVAARVEAPRLRETLGRLVERRLGGEIS